MKKYFKNNFKFYFNEEEEQRLKKFKTQIDILNKIIEKEKIPDIRDCGWEISEDNSVIYKELLTYYSPYILTCYVITDDKIIINHFYYKGEGYGTLHQWVYNLYTDKYNPDYLDYYKMPVLGITGMKWGEWFAPKILEEIEKNIHMF